VRARNSSSGDFVTNSSARFDAARRWRKVDAQYLDVKFSLHVDVHISSWRRRASEADMCKTPRMARAVASTSHGFTLIAPESDVADPANSESTTLANAPFACRHATCVAATRFIPSTIGVTTQTSAMQCSAQRSASEGSDRRWTIARPRPGVANFPLIRPTMVSMFSSTVWWRRLFARATCAANACECCPPAVRQRC
jgi:hypothetical protein